MKHIIVVHLALAALLLSASCKPVSRMFNSGGTIFVVDVIAPEGAGENVMERVVNITQFRLDAIGVDGEVKRSDDRRIEVRIFGKPDLGPIRKLLFTNYKLELKKVVSPPSPSPVRQFPNNVEAQAALEAGQQVLPYAEIPEVSSFFVIVEKDPIVTGEHIRSAQAISYSGSDFDYQISFSLNQEGAAKFGDWTASNINNYLAVVLNDKVESIAYIKTQISDMGEITGRFTKAHAEEIATSLSSGKMPAELKVVEERPF